MVSLSQLVLHYFFRYSYRHSTPSPTWGSWRVPRVDWTAQLKIVTTLTAQVDAQKAVVDIRDTALGVANAKVDVADVAQDAAQAALVLTKATVVTALDERDEMMAAYQDEDRYLESLKSDLEFHTQRLRDTKHYF